MSWVEARDLIVKRGGSVDPSKHPDEIFELYSVPSHDAQSPEIVSGSEIGSTKQIVQQGDVLLCKIVPHIRRSWVVGKPDGHRLIASSEWIVFRGDGFWPKYLKRLLVCDWFHCRLMQTVSGVGGSLLRARPAEVARIKIPLPPVSEQKRIAAILDQADALRDKRRQAIAKLDELLQSVFLDMFGDPVTNPKEWGVVQFGDVTTSRLGKMLDKKRQTGEYTRPYLANFNVQWDRFELSELREMDFSPADQQEFKLLRGDLLVCEGGGSWSMCDLGRANTRVLFPKGIT